MKRFVPWSSIILYGGLAFLSGLVGWIIALVVKPNNFPGLFSIWCICSGTSLFFLTFILERYYASPSYITTQGVQVWTDAASYLQFIPAAEHVENVLTDFAYITPLVLAESRDLDSGESAISNMQITNMYRNMKIMFTVHSVAIMAWNYPLREMYCAQKKRQIIIHHLPPFNAQQLCHVLFHAMDDLILYRKPDCKHRNTSWWRAAFTVQTKVDACLLKRIGQSCSTELFVDSKDKKNT
jgi:hypothetical protein